MTQENQGTEQALIARTLAHLSSLKETSSSPEALKFAEDCWSEMQKTDDLKPRENWQFPSPSDPQWRRKVLRLDEAHHPRVAKACEAMASFIAAYCRQDRSNGTWLVLAGDLGTGKTTLARAAVRYVRNRAADILYAPEWRDKSRSPRAEFEKWADLVAIEKEIDFRDQLYDIDEAHLVALDDIGREADKFRAGVPQVRLAEVLDRCKNKWLIVTTNIVRRDWGNAYDDRIVSRLSVASYVSLEDVPDYRPNLRST